MITFARFPAGDPVPEPGNGGAVAAQVAEAFADVDEARSRELDRLLKTKYANTDPRQIPPEVLHQPQEDEMPKGKANRHVQPETVKAMAVAELLQLQGEIADELKIRRDEAALQLAELNRALGVGQVTGE